ncbi:hypothetical protein KY290_026168 [Solanum tuberosum]|uniref:Uncharacterized protein n=1 Tax=Solanum tuberosum TaxID=4113 RepID=A0ABQ7UVQ8_SOLTU|nr:hypothetical protein KY289_025266 [Solanum tuberosum]KAH0755898.1 hypothetical protein KY290_026168 [Solanum tuberosum]
MFDILLYVSYDIETRFNREHRNYDGSSSKGEDFLDIFSKSSRPYRDGIYDVIPKKDFDMARWYVLNNCEEAEPFLQEHKEELLKQIVVNIEDKHREQFPLWFKRKIQQLYNKEKLMSIKKLFPLAIEPDVRGRTHTGCIVNGVRFHVQRRDELRKSQNCGIVIAGYHENEKENSEPERDELHITNDEVYQDISLENDSIVNDTVDILSQLHRDDVDSIILDANVIKLEAQTEHEVEIDHNEDDSDQEDDTMIEYVSDHEDNEGNTSTNDDEVDSTCDGDDIGL